MPFADPITPVSGRYGAPLGRHVGTDFLCEGASPIYLRRVPLDSGGYDKGGAYWGHGLPLYCAQDQDGNTIIFRSRSRAAAKAELRERFGNLRFYR